MNIFDFASRATSLHSVPASNAVKPNMAANVEFQDLAASTLINVCHVVCEKREPDHMWRAFNGGK